MTSQPTFFPDGEDLPLFSGAPIRVEPQVFIPHPTAAQPALLDLHPQFGAAEPQYTPLPPSADARAQEEHHV